MSRPDDPGALPHLPRGGIEDAILAFPVRLQIVSARRGAGKTTLLRRIASRLPARDLTPVYLDVETITGPLDLATRLPEVLRRAGAIGPAAASLCGRIASETQRRRPDPALLVDLSLALAAAGGREPGRAPVLLLDELGEIGRLARHAGLRDALSIVSERLAGPGAPLVVATVSPASRPGPVLEHLTRAAGEDHRLIELPPLSAGEVAALVAPVTPEPGGVERWMRATGGHPLYVQILARRVAAGCDLAAALAREMTPPAGLLHQECRFDYHLLMERCRGHSVVRAILRLLSRDAGCNLSGVAAHLRIALPTALDYLSWLLEVGLIRRDGSGYVIADPLLALWVALNDPEPADPLERVVDFLETPRREPRPPARPRGPRPAPRAVPAESRPGPAPRRDSLMEID